MPPMTEASDWAAATEQQLLDQTLKLAPLHGWTRRTATLAGKALGMSAAETELLLPRGPEDRKFVADLHGEGAGGTCCEHGEGIELGVCTSGVEEALERVILGAD